MLNQQIALKLAQVADLLEQRGANPFRVSAYRHASDTVAWLDRDIADIATEDGSACLIALPGNGSAGNIKLKKQVRD